VKIQIEDMSSVKRRVHVEVPANLVSEEFEKAYQELKRTARVRGFRPGKAPRSVLERYYGDQVRYEVTTRLIQESYGKSLEENGLTPVTPPEIQDIQFQPGEDFRYTAVMEIKPKVEVSEYEGLEVEREDLTVSEQQVDARLDEIRELFARLEDLETPRAIQEGDFVLVQHRMMMDGELQAEQQPQDQMLEMAPGRVEEGLMKALVGLQAGEETQVPHRFPPDHANPKLAGREGTLHVTVKTIRKKVLPELDDAFAKRLGEYPGLAELRVKVRQEVEEGERQRIRAAANEAIIEKLLKRHEFDVPEALVELQIQEMIRNTQRRLAAHGVTLETAGSSPEQMRASYRESAIRAVRASIILEAVAAKEGMEVKEDGLREAYDRIARQSGRDIRQVEDAYREPAALEMLKASILEERALDFLRDRAKMVDKIS
jgi:trigger factor